MGPKMNRAPVSNRTMRHIPLRGKVNNELFVDSSNDFFFQKKRLTIFKFRRFGAPPKTPLCTAVTIVHGTFIGLQLVRLMRRLGGRELCVDRCLPTVQFSTLHIE